MTDDIQMRPKAMSAFDLLKSTAEPVPHHRLVAVLVSLSIFPHLVNIGLLFMPLSDPSTKINAKQVAFAFFYLMLSSFVSALPIVNLNLLLKERPEWYSNWTLYTINCLSIPFFSWIIPALCGKYPPFIGSVLLLGAILIVLISLFHVYYFYRQFISANRSDPLSRKDFSVMLKVASALMYPPIFSILFAFLLVPVIYYYILLSSINSPGHWIAYIIVVMTACIALWDLPPFLVFEIFQVRRLHFVPDDFPSCSKFIIDMAFDTLFQLTFPTISRSDSYIPYVFIILLHMGHEGLKCIWMFPLFQKWMMKGKRDPSSLLEMAKRMSTTSHFIVEPGNPTAPTELDSEFKWIHRERKRLFLRTWSTLHSSLFFITFYSISIFGQMGAFFPFKRPDDGVYFWRPIAFSAIIVIVRLLVTVSVAFSACYLQNGPRNEFYSSLKEGYYLLANKKTCLYVFVAMMCVNVVSYAVFLKHTATLFNFLT